MCYKCITYCLCIIQKYYSYVYIITAYYYYYISLGGDMLFGRRIGFSGTPSDILPLELGSCQYERGSDGRVAHYLTSPSIVQVVHIAPGWNSYSLLDYIAQV